MKEGDDFPQGDKVLRKEDHQAMLREFIFEIKDGKHRIIEVVPRDKVTVPAGLHVLLSDSDALVRSSAQQGRGDASAPLLRTEGLTIRFGGLTALNNVNFEVQRGEIRAVIGPNGAGKSTFFNCLTGVLRPTAGRVIFNGEDITGLPPNRISQKGIARSYQITNILPNATTLENVRIAAQSRRHSWSMFTHHRDYRDIIDKAEAVLQAVGLLDKADELAANLSHGEQRNLEIGIALATEPQLLCLDEPTAGMSAAETHDTMQLVRRIAKDLTILIVEHDMQVVMELAQPHHRAALRRGAGRGPARRDPAEPAGAGGLSQDMSPPDPATQPLVTVEDIHTYYGKSHILHGVSLQVGPGEVVGLLGRNGVGKSTTLKTIMGLVTPSQGRIVFEGKPITGMPSHKLARLGIGYVPEDRRIFKLLTVMENLRTGLDRAGVTEARKQGAARQGLRLLSRVSPSAATRPAARCRAASSRCWRSPAR